ncbi:MAG: hypothetical protein K2M55_00480 [Muribaculaceae bacterium]|nr:hypothetical protein [Muribaculaceae bacterium]
MTSLKLISLTALLLALPAVSTAKSAKRGAGWDDKTVSLNAHHAALLEPGVSWVYNWGPDISNGDLYNADFTFLPMAWNGAYNASRIRQWLSAHPETKYLLGFNEPNFASQARMTPAEAAGAWPGLEAIAEEYGVKLVAPALNFTDSQVGGRFWNPYEWYDEFFRLYPDAKVDCLAMHCYMNWYSANTWLATEYFYSDLYNPRKDCYGRYPNLVKFLNSFKETHGRFPGMMLTEFCSWENDGTIKDVDFQIDQMTQKLQKLEQSELVEGYAWFMANAGAGATAYPYMSLFERNSADSDLSELGKIYVYLSDFDTTRRYAPGETIQAKDYVDATTDDRQVKVRTNTEAASHLPLRIEIPAGGYADYVIDVPTDGEYKFTFHIEASKATSITLYVDSKKDTRVDVAAAAGWRDVELTTNLKSGIHRVMPYISGDNSLTMNSLCFTTTDGIFVPATDEASVVSVYNLYGISLGNPELSALPHGVYVLKYSNGTTGKIKI